MLISLSIRNIVLIEALDLDCKQGLSALTGETGAGKSILLDALGLALGMRAETRLIRKNAEKASVTAHFSFLETNKPVFALLKTHDIDTDNQIILRRSLTSDGRSKAFINDQPVSLTLLKTIGKQLVEIHGQFETHGLLQAKTHLNVVDSYGNYQDELSNVANSFQLWKNSELAFKEARQNLQKNKMDEDYIKHMVDELDKLGLEEGEEKELTKKKALLSNKEKMAEAVHQCNDLLSGEKGAETLIMQAQSHISRLASDIDIESVNNANEALDRVYAELEEAISEIESLSGNDFNDDMSLDMIEERLFALRDCARKHGCGISDLPEKLDELSKQLIQIDNQDSLLNDLEIAENKQRKIYYEYASKLTDLRKNSALSLQKSLLKELPQLKLEKVRFETEIKSFDSPEKWTAKGINQIQFLVATNPGQEPAPLNKTASGGELSRLMLAFKVVMAGKNYVPVLVFDEIDAGVGGAVADAVGAHLKKLSLHHQVLVVTHSPQVAARADVHLNISKTQAEDTVTHIKELLSYNEKTEEIARMLSGQDVTPEARAAAGKLMEVA